MEEWPNSKQEGNRKPHEGHDREYHVRTKHPAYARRPTGTLHRDDLDSHHRWGRPLGQTVHPLGPPGLSRECALVVAAPDLDPYPAVGLRHSDDYQLRRAFVLGHTIRLLPLGGERGGRPIHDGVALPRQEVSGFV